MWFIALLSRLPFWALYKIADALYFIMYRVARYRRALVRKNLRNAFPELTEKELAGIEKDFYRRLCDQAVETVKLLTLTPDELTRRMRLINEDFTLQCCKSSWLCLSSHQFNWEWTLASSSVSLPLPIHFVYQRQQSQFSDRALMRARERFGAKGIERGQVGRTLARQRHALRVLCVVADQFPGHGDDKKYWTHFLHQDTAFFAGAGQLAIALGYPVFSVRIRRVKRGYYTYEVVPVASPPYGGEGPIVEQYAKGLACAIGADKAGWLWSHNRWKTKRPT